ncbi:hypothetical protein CKM354_000513300 [Cercospora kikuchii]|uniref:Carrier domain-containing protein n=1 Tax=Cercospora kikuchii TaxID=84275 RepID=A0A9P3CCQ9_9PEZI|nr:uncharacterized protein CKM354_000513300 [Cercospora kikuchii]GIZ41844.1 hypothetical protein CKM354_000513300 [Cercospora kikuchii]
MATISDSDLKQIWQWNATVPETLNGVVHDLILEVARRQPDAPAIEAWDGSITYGELDRYSQRWAAHLRSLGVGPEVHVSLLSEKSKWVSVAMLGVMRSGGVTVVMDITQPDERLGLMMDQVRPHVVLASDGAWSTAEKLATRAMICSIDGDRLDRESHATEQDNPQRAIVAGENALWVSFTSGSTGRPKAVVVEHRSLYTELHVQAEPTAMSTSSRVFDYAGYSWDMTWYNVLFCWHAGGCLCVPSEEDRRQDPSAAIKRFRANFANITPTVADLLDDEALHMLKGFETIGERASPKLLSRIHPSQRYRNTYGASECGSLQTAALNPETPDNIGYGSGVVTWLVNEDEDGRFILAPIGESGEIWLEGPLVSRGYLRDETQTAAAFVEDPPFLLAGDGGKVPGRRGRLYRMGDLAKYAPDGSLRIQGRRDWQVKLRGQRVELGEVEHHVRAVLSRACGEEGLHVAAMVAIPKGHEIPTLIVYVVLPGAANLDETELRLELSKATDGVDDKLRTRIPAYMVPKGYIPLRQLPLTYTGKRNRAALTQKITELTLREIAAFWSSDQTSRRSPASKTEILLHSLIADILDLETDEIAAEDDFLRLGGDSVLAVRLTAAARKRGTAISVAEVFAHPRICDLAEYIDQRNAREGLTTVTNPTDPVAPFSLLQHLDREGACEEAARQCELDVDAIEDIFPCTALQAGFMALTAQRAEDYIGRQTYQLRADVDVARFKEAWELVFAALPILRTRIVDLRGEDLVQVIVKESSATAWDLGTTTYIPSMGLGSPLANFCILKDQKGTKFQWTMHHALFDGISLPLMLARLRYAYEHLNSGPPPPQFQAFVRRVQQISREEAKNAWQKHLSGLEAHVYPPLPFPSYQPRADHEVVHRMQGISWPAGSGFTAATVIRTALHLLLAEYTGSSDVVYGVTTSGRAVPVDGVESMIAPTLATAPTRAVIDFEHGEQVRQLLTRVQHDSLALVEPEQLGLQNIRLDSDDAQRACDFQTLLLVEPAEQADDSTPIFVSEAYEEALDTAVFNSYGLLIHCYLDAENGARVTLSFDSVMLPLKQAERMGGQLEHIVRQLCIPENHEMSVTSLRIASPQDLQDIWSWNAAVPVTDMAEAETVHQLIQLTVERQSESLAIESWDGRLTYAQLDELSTTWACYIAKTCNVGPEVIVPLCLEKGIWMTVAAVSVMKAGGVCCALDISQPLDRLATIVGQVAAPLVLASAGTAELARSIAGKSGTVLRIDDETLFPVSESVDRQERLESLPQARSSNALYVSFTSGSTGLPKGVVIEHGNFLHAIAHQRAFLGINETSRILDFASPAFDVFWENLLMALTAGACLCTPSAKQRMDDLASFSKQYRVNYAEITPAHVRAVDFSHVSTINLSGEALNYADIEYLENSPARIIDSYGPAECTVTATATELTRPFTRRSGKPGLGVGLGCATWVVSIDKPNQLAPVGATGELYIEGTLVGRGYLNDHAKTEANFIRDPQWLIDGTRSRQGRQGRLYRTGDLVRYSSDGSLNYVGRRDDMVKIRGQRVELGDVERNVQRVIRDHQNNSTASVDVIAEVAQKALIAFIVRPSKAIMELVNSNTLATLLAEHISEFMIPVAFFTLDEVPLSLSGKINRRMLRAQGEALMGDSLAKNDVHNTVINPTSELEKGLRDVWAEVLQRRPDTVSTDAHFTTLGGDSIRAMQVVSRARSRGVDVSVVDLLRLRTIQNIVKSGKASHTVPREASAGTKKDHALWKPTLPQKRSLATIGLTTQDVSDVYKCTPMQEGMLFSKKTGAASYLTHSVWECKPRGAERISISKLESAWQAVLAHHSIFATVFLDDEQSGGYLQAVRRFSDFSDQVEVVETGDISPAQWLTHHFARPTFQLAQPEVFVSIATSKTGECACRLDTNHALIDAASVGVLLDQLDTAYRGSRLPPSPRFRDVIDYIESTKTDNRIQYWSSYLADVQPCHFPTEIADGSLENAKTQTMEVLHDGDTAIYDFCRAKGVTRAAFIQLVWALVLTYYTRSDEACFGFLASGRDMPVDHVDQAVGPLINMLISLVPLQAGKGVEELIQSVSEDTISHLEHQHVSLAEIQRSVGKGSLFNSSITVYDAGSFISSPTHNGDAAIHPTGLQFQECDASDEQEFDFGIAMELRGSSTIIDFAFRENKFSMQSASHVVAKLREAIQFILEDPKASTASIRQDFFQYTTGVSQDKLDAFWQDQHRDSEAPTFPVLPSPNYKPLLDEECIKKINLPLASQEHSPNVFVHAAWALLQAKYTGSDQALFGVLQEDKSDSSNARAPSHRAALPMQVTLSSDKTSVEDLLEQVHKKTALIRESNTLDPLYLRNLVPGNDDAIRLQTLVVCKPPRRSQLKANGALSNGALSNGHGMNGDSRVAVTNGMSTPKQNGSSGTHHEERTTAALVLEFEASSSSTVEIKSSFDSSVLSVEIMERMLHQLEHIMGLLTDSKLASTDLRDIDVISDSDLRDIWQWNSDIPEPIMTPVHAIFQRTVELQPGADAVAAWDGQFQYRELDEISTHLARYLVARGVGSSITAVPLLFEKSRWMPVAMLAVSKAGAAAVTMDISQPAQRLATIAAQVNARIILCSVSAAEMASQVLGPEALKSLDEAVVPIDATRILNMKIGSTPASLPRVDPESTIFIQFTSGSTGIPKGCCISHANLATGIEYQYRARLEYGPTTRVLDFASYAFDVCWLTNMGVLCTGGVVCVPSESQRKNDIAGFMRDMHVNSATFTPTMADTIRDHDVLRSLKYIKLGGEFVPEALVKRLQKYTRVWIAYGPSECTVGVAFAKREEGDQGIGRGVAAGTFIVDPVTGKLSPVGAVGELWVSGPLVTEGYLNDPIKTSESFIENPSWYVSAGHQGRLYKTGDLVKYNPDGSIQFVERIDTQVKHRGQRMELDEVRFHVLQQLVYESQEDLEKVQVVAEMVTPKDRQTPSLVAFIVPRDAPRMNASVPSYMVPVGFIPLSDLPTTATAKIDRLSLQAIGSELLFEQLINDQDTKAGVYQEPKTQLERHIQRLMSDILDIPPKSISAQSGFLQLGGDSVLSMRLVALARQEGIVLDVADIFNQPTLRDLATTARLDDESIEQTIAPFSLLGQYDTDAIRHQVAGLCNVSSEQVVDAFPCTSLQAGLLALTSRHDGDYIWQMTFELHSRIDLQRFKRAYEELFASATILRTRIVHISEQDGPVQAIVDEPVLWHEQPGNISMGPGTPLSHVALASSPDNKSAYFTWSLHHSVYDGHSMQLLMGALRDAYEGREIRPLTPFQGFIKHVAAVSETPQEAEFWSQQFIGLDAARYPPLPTREYVPRVDSSVKHRIENMGPAPRGLTLATCLRGAWALLLTQLTGRTDTVFGAVVTGRQAPVSGIESCAGPTLATVPVRISLDYDSSLKQSLEQIQRQATDMIPFEQAGLQRVRTMSAEAEEACNFQSLMVINASTSHNEHAESDADAFFDMSDLPLDVNTANNDDAFATHALTLVIDQDRPQGLQLTLFSDGQIVSPVEAENIARQLEHILRLICTPGSEDEKVGRLNLASENDLQEIWSWNQEIPKAVTVCVHDIFADTVRRQPEAQAVCSWDGTLTFRQLDQLSTRLSGHMSRLGVRRATLVPLYFEKSMWMTVAMWAVMKAGGASAGNDITQPKERLQKIVGQVQPKVVLASARSADLARSLLEPGAEVVIVDEAHLQDLPTCESVDSDVQPSDPLFLVFTSGSTGEPKGVTITHENIASAIYLQADALEISKPGARLLDFASYAFDVTWQSNVMAVAQGSCVCVPSDDQRQNHLSQAMADLKVTSATLTPLVAETLDLDVVKGLRYIEMGGEMVSDALIKRMPTRVRVAYGPSEATLGVAYAKKDRGDIGIGPPTGMCAWLVDPITSDRLVGKGCIGELWIEGPLVSPGYMNDPAKTAAAFIEDPKWLTVGGPGSFASCGRRGRLYRSGDLVRYAQNGHLIYVGRKDVQVKIRGQRVELSEIESIVTREIRVSQDGHEAAAEKISVVADLVSPEDVESPLLVAFVSLGSRIGVDAESLLRSAHARVAAHAASYMVPVAYLLLKAMPRTTTGKADRRELRKLAGTKKIAEYFDPSRSSAGNARMPSSPAEQMLQALWKATFKVSRPITAADNFFLLGGDSIKAMKLVSAIRQSGRSLTVADVFKHPILQDLAQQIKGHIAESIHVPKPFSLLKSRQRDLNHVRNSAAVTMGISPADVEDIYPCTPLQEGLLALAARRHGAYTAEFDQKLDSAIDLDRFKHAWKMVEEATPILRTRFLDLEGCGIVQCVVRDTSKWIEDEPQPETQSSNRVLGVPLSEVALHTDQRSGGVIWRWRIHHALYDEPTVDLVMTSLQQAYHQGTASKLMPLSSFIKQVRSISLEDSQKFWQKEFAGLEASPFPGLPHPKYQPQADTAFEQKIKLRGGPPAGFTMSTLLKTAWALLVTQRTNNNEAVYGVITSGRQATGSDLATIAGPTIATVPVRVRLTTGAEEKSLDLQSLLEQTQLQAVDMTPFEQSGLQYIQKASPEAEEACRFQSLLVVQPAADEEQAAEDSLFMKDSTSSTEGERIPVPAAFSTYALAVVCQLNDGHISITFGLDSNVVSTASARRIASQFEHIIHQICDVTNIGRSITDLDLVSGQDMMDIAEWNSRISIDPANVPMHELIAAIARKHPEAPAVCSHDGNLTYGKLLEHSHRLAQYLVTVGVGPGTIVPILFEKSLWFPVTCLAIMQTGAGTCAMDVTQPEERLKVMVRKSSPLVAILCSTSSAEVATRIRLDDRAAIIAVDLEFLDSLQSSTVSMPLVDPQSPLYVVFTSGSTGEPKGVVITHANLASMSRLQSNFLELGLHSRVLDFASYAFDSTWAFNFLTLAAGGCVCIPSEWERKNDTEGAMRRLQVTQGTFSPTFAETLSDETVQRLNFIELGGEAVPQRLIDRFLKLTRVRIAYGPSEATIGVMFAKQEQGHQGLGFGLGCRTWIVSPETSRLVAIGSVGELWLQGPLVGQGYLNDEAQTRKAFVDSPQWLRKQFPELCGPAKERLYRTGDIVSYAEDGSITFHGRKDGQVKLRGQRLELADVENNVLKQVDGRHNQEFQVVAEIVKSAGTRDILMAFLKFSGSEDLSEDELAGRLARLIQGGVHDRLKATLPLYMVPARYVALQDMPRTTTGKIDRRRLRAMEHSDELIIDPTATAGTRRPPETAMEVRLQKLWSVVLDIPQDNISANDSFMALGGDSIQTMRLANLCQREGLEMAVMDIFTKPLLSELAETLETASEQSITSPSPFSLVGDYDLDNLRSEVQRQISATSGTIEDIMPITHSQREYLDGSIEGGPTGIHWFYIDLEPSIETARLLDSCASLVKHLEVLRLTFAEVQGQLYQILLSDPPITTEVVQVPSGHTVDEWSKTAFTGDEDDLQSFIGRTFTRFVLLKDCNGSRRLAVRLWHAQYDGESLPRVADTLQKIYQGQSLEDQPSVSSLVALQQSTKLDRKYWNSILEGSSMTYLQPEIPLVQSNKSVATLHYTGTIQLTKKSKRIGRTPATNFTAACALTLAQLNGNKDVLFGRLTSGRAALPARLRNIVFNCLTYLPVRVRLSESNDTFRDREIAEEVLDQVHRQYIDGLASENIHFEDIAKQCETWSAKSSEFGVLTLYQNGTRAEESQKDGDVEMSGSSFAMHGLRAATNEVYKSDTVVIAGVPSDDGKLEYHIIAKSTLCDQEYLETAAEILRDTLEKIDRLDAQ